jgi:hypothetical protein
MDYIVTEAGIYSQGIPVIAKTLALLTCMKQLARMGAARETAPT